MEEVTISRFTVIAQAVADGARALGLVVPGFRSPPRLAAADRTIRRGRGSVLVSVRLSGRPVAAVAADLIEGVVVANRLDQGQALRVRAELWDRLASATSTERAA